MHAGGAVYWLISGPSRQSNGKTMWNNPRLSLLYDMGQLMRQNPMIRGLCLGTEPDVISVGKSLCAKGLGSLLGSGPAVDAHSIEIVTKHRFMATAQNRRQRFTLIAIVKQLLGYHGFMSRASGAIRAVQP